MSKEEHTSDSCFLGKLSRDGFSCSFMTVKWSVRNPLFWPQMEGLLPGSMVLPEVGSEAAFYLLFPREAINPFYS